MKLADQRAHFVPQHAATVLVTGADTGGRLALVETVEAQGAEPPCHCHHWEDETLYVLEGELIVYCAGTGIHAPAGTAVVLPRAIEHAFVVLTPTARVLTMFAPAGFEAWYRDAGEMMPWDGDLDRIVATAARYGCEITGPRPSYSNTTSSLRELT